MKQNNLSATVCAIDCRGISLEGRETESFSGSCFTCWVGCSAEMYRGENRIFLAYLKQYNLISQFSTMLWEYFLIFLWRWAFFVFSKRVSLIVERNSTASMAYNTMYVWRMYGFRTKVDYGRTQHNQLEVLYGIACTSRVHMVCWMGCSAQPAVFPILHGFMYCVCMHSSNAFA